MADTLHQNNQRLVLGLETGISSVKAQNKYYSMALQDNLLLLSSINPDEEEGKLTQHVLRNKTVFLDYWNDKTKDLLSAGIKELYQAAPFDGLWLGLNEATGFCDGECPSGIIPENVTSECSVGESFKNNTWWTSYDQQQEISTFKIPFIPGPKHNLDHLAISLNASHPSNNLTEYDTHSLFGHVQG